MTAKPSPSTRPPKGIKLTRLQCLTHRHTHTSLTMQWLPGTHKDTVYQQGALMDRGSQKTLSETEEENRENRKLKLKKLAQL